MPFAFRRQPFKTVYLLGAAIYVLGALPIWTVISILPSTRPRRSWTLKRSLFVILLRNIAGIMNNTSLSGPIPLEVCEKDAHELRLVWVKAAPDPVVGEVRELAEKNGVKAIRAARFWVGSRGLNGEGEGHLLLPWRRTCRTTSSDHREESPIWRASAPFYEGTLGHFGKDVRIFGLEYRLSSAAPFAAENPFPASLIDAIAGYRYLVEDVGFHPSQR